LSLADSSDEQTQATAIAAFAQCADPRINALAIRLLRQSLRTIKQGVLRLFIRSYRPGDHEAINAVLDASPLAELTCDDRHHIGYDLVEVAKTQSDPDLARSLEWVYEHSPCSNCRGTSLEQLIERRRARRELLDESRWDCSAQTREIARRGTSTPIGQELLRPLRKESPFRWMVRINN
jgi:hypothetical protein